jgi:hypothetical protein
MAAYIIRLIAVSWKRELIIKLVLGMPLLLLLKHSSAELVFEFLQRLSCGNSIYGAITVKSICCGRKC